MNVNISIAQEADAGAMCSLIRRSIIEVCGCDYAHIEGFIDDWLTNKTPTHIKEWIRHIDNRVLVASNAQTSLGVGAINRSGQILLFYVDPDFIGQGIGTKLLASIESHARGLGLKQITVNSSLTAQQFYACQGFRKSGLPIEQNGLEIEHLMTKSL